MCSKLCSSIWEQADRSPSTSKLRQALFCHASGSYETARDVYEQVLSELSETHVLTQPIKAWIKAAASGLPLSDRIRRDIKAHVEELFQLELPGLGPVSLAPSRSREAIMRMAAELSAKARQGLVETPEVLSPPLKLVVNN